MGQEDNLQVYISKFSMPINLGIGPRERNAPVTVSTVRARIFFFRAIEQIEPQVVVSLHDEVFINFLSAVYVSLESRIKTNVPFEQVTMADALQGIRSSISTEEIKSLIPSPNALGKIKRNFDTYTRLKAWAEKWGLHEEWCLDYALRAMKMWLYWEAQRFYKSWWRANSGDFAGSSGMTTEAIWAEDNFIAHIDFIDYVRGGDLDKAAFTFEYMGVSYRNSGWSPFYEEIGEWKKKVRDEFKALLQKRRDEGKPAPKGILRAFDTCTKEHVDFINSAAKKFGLKVTPKKQDYSHFLWLVHYHVQRPNWSLQKIGTEFNADAKTISDGINRTAELIGLTLRKPLPAGRKRHQH